MKLVTALVTATGILSTASASHLRGGVPFHRAKDRDLLSLGEGQKARRLAAAKCKKLVVYRDVRDYREDKTYVGRHGYLGQKGGKPGDTLVLKVPLYDKSDRSEQKQIGIFEEVWTWSFDGDGMGSMMFTMHDEDGEERGQLAAEFTLAGLQNPVTGGTLEFAGTNGYLTFDQAGRFSKENGYYNELTLNYDCF